MRITRLVVLAVVVVAGSLLGAGRAAAQNEPVRQWEPRGFDFTPDGVWRRKAAAVRLNRFAALARGDLRSLNAGMAARSAGIMAAPGPNSCHIPNVVCGVLYEPIFLVGFKNTDPATLRAPSEYDDALLAATPTQGRPYTIRTFYEEMSNGLLSIQGQVLGWSTLDENDTWYEGTQNGLTSSGHIAQLMSEAVAKTDAGVDFGQFDNDGPDGVPNSGDDDGYVDLAVFVQPEKDGACGGNSNIWSHRFSYGAWVGGTQPWINTNDNSTRAGIGKIRINNYTIQSGVGGATSCDATSIMPIGTTAHETGHGFGLPDFYDTNPQDADNSEGIGHWGLMSSGNYARPYSPAHMEGFSRMALGWVTVRDLVPGASYSFGPYTVSDTVFRVTPPTTQNSRGEYYLIENRQGALGDSALVNPAFTSNGKAKGAGLLIWHVDPLQYNSGLGFNAVNTGPIHGLKLEQADNLDELGSSTTGVRNRGDGGDAYPGTSGNTVFGAFTSPAGTLNSGRFSGVVVDSIRQVVAGGAMRFRLRFMEPVVFTAAGAGTVTAPGGFASGDLLAQGDSVTLTASATGAQVFACWTGDTASTSATLKLRATHEWNVLANFELPLQVADSVLRSPLAGTAWADTLVMSGGNGTYTFQLLTGSLPNGIVLGTDGVLSGSATRDSTFTFTVRATSGCQSATLALRLTVTGPTLVTAKVVNQLLGIGAPLTSAEIHYLDLLGNNNNAFDVGDFMAWLDHTGNVVSADVMRRIMTRGGR